MHCYSIDPSLPLSLSLVIPVIIITITCCSNPAELAKMFLAMENHPGMERPRKVNIECWIVCASAPARDTRLGLVQRPGAIDILATNEQHIPLEKSYPSQDESRARLPRMS